MLIALDQGAYILAGTFLTQLVVMFGIVYAGKNAKKARQLGESTNDAVNHVDVAGGELKLIDQVRNHGRQLDRHEEYHEWTASALSTIAAEIGVRVPPLPEFDTEDAA